MKLQGVEYIPSGLVTCFVNELEVRIVELGYEGFVFRTPERLQGIELIRLHFLAFTKSKYQSVQIDLNQMDLKKIECEEEAFYVLYTIPVEQTDYLACVKEIIGNYSRYISLKLSEDDSGLSEELTGYPAVEDEKYAQDFQKQKEKWFSRVDTKQYKIEGEYELALSLDTKTGYQQYLSQGIVKFQAQRLTENYLDGHPLCQKPVKRLYIGNQFCHNLLPDKEKYIKLMEKAREEQLGITLVFTYLRDEYVEETRELLELIYQWCKEKQQVIEVVVNDWGMMELLNDMHPYMNLSLGILLNKRRKDPRYAYKLGIEENKDKLSENYLNDKEFHEILREKWNVTRFEYETGPLLIRIPEGHHSLHFPYYQTNTSQYCTLYATCQYGDRGNQRLVRNCPYYCEEKVFLYPEHLKMVGRFNSLFGFQTSVFADSKKISGYLNQGIDRLVLTLL